MTSTLESPGGPPSSGSGSSGGGSSGGDGSGVGGSGGGPFDAGSTPAPGRRRRSRVPLISAIAVGCVTALLVAILATSKSTSQLGTQAVTPLQNKPAPEISGPTLGGGNGALSSLKGKWVLINFFASWCVPCQQEQPELVKFQNAHASGDAAIFGVRFDDPDTGPIQSLMTKSGATWPIVDDPNAKITYSVTGPPETFLVSPSGVVLVHIIGPITDTKLEDLLHQAQLVVSTPGAASTAGGAAPSGAAGGSSAPAAPAVTHPSGAANSPSSHP